MIVADTNLVASYDAEFVALAEELGVPLVTDDRRLLSACRDVAISIDDFAGDANVQGARADAADQAHIMAELC